MRGFAQGSALCGFDDNPKCLGGEIPQNKAKFLKIEIAMSSKV